MTHAAALPASMSFDIAGLVTEHLEDADRLGATAAGYVAHALAPLVTTDLDATEPAIVVTAVDEVPIPLDCVSTEDLLAVVRPAVMTARIMRYPGAGLLEKSIGKHRPGYDEYVRHTNAFFPGPPK